MRRKPRTVLHRIGSFREKRFQVCASRSQRILEEIEFNHDELAGYPCLEAAHERATSVGSAQLADSAAVVLSSERLIQVPMGQEIDAHDYVFRVNIAPTLGYEDEVGKRTTHRVLGRSWAYQEQHDEVLHWCPTDANHATNMALMTELESRVSYRRVAARVISPERWFARWQRRYFKGIPTNGFRAVSLALMSARRVFVYGVDFENQKNPGRKKYFEDTIEAQRALMQAMSEIDFGTINADYWTSLSEEFRASKTTEHQTFFGGLEYEFYQSHPRIVVVAK